MERRVWAVILVVALAALMVAGSVGFLGGYVLAGGRSGGTAWGWNCPLRGGAGAPASPVTPEPNAGRPLLPFGCH